MIALHRLLVLLALGMFAPRSPAQEPWGWARFDVQDGLPADDVHQVLEARDGTAWAATRAGVAYFDGYRWHALEGLKPSAEPLLSPGAGDELYVLSGGLLYEVRDRRARRPRQVGVDTLGVVPGQEGDLLVVSSRLDRLRRLFPDGREELVDVPAEIARLGGSLVVRAVTDGVLVTTPTRLYLLREGRWRMLLETGAGLLVHDAAQDARGHGVFSVRYPVNAAGIWTYEPGEGATRWVEHGHDPIDVVAIEASGRRNVLCATGEMWRETADDWQRLLDVPPSVGEAQDVCVRETGECWIATGHGLFLSRHTREAWHRPALLGGTRVDWVNEILVRDDGSVWLGTEDGLIRYDDLDAEPEHVLDEGGPGKQAITAMGEDAAGRLWVGSGYGIRGALCLEDGRWRAVQDPDGLGAGRVHRIREDKHGRLWFLCIAEVAGREEPGAFLLDGDELERWDEERGLLSGRVYDVDEAPDGTLWFGTAAGLSSCSPTGEWSHWTMADGLTSERVFCVEAARDGRVWFGHQTAGLGCIEDGRRLRYFSTEDGLGTDDVWEIVEDERGWVWVSGQGDLTLLRDDMTVCLGEDIGLPFPRTWPLVPGEQRVLAGTLGRGLMWLDLDSLTATGPRVWVEQASSDGAPLAVRWRAHAEWGAVRSERIYTRHRLDAGAWSEWTREREFRADELPPGSHRLELQARGSLGDLGPVETVPIDVPVPPELRLYFLVPMALLVLSVGALLVVGLRRKRRFSLELRRSEERYRDLVENANDLICTHDLEGRLTSLNRSAQSALGCAASELEQRSLLELCEPAGRERLRAVLDDVRAGRRPGLYELVLLDRNGAAVPLEAVTRLVSLGGRPVGMQTVARDVRERRRLEEELRHSQKMEAVGRLAGGIAHDFNNLLVVINGYSELLLDSLGEESGDTAYARQIRRAGARAAELTRQLLAFSRKQLMRPESLDLGALVRGIEPLLKPLIGEDVGLELRTADPVWVCADPVQIQQVIFNLATNARDAMPTGGKLSIEVGHAPDGRACLTVADTGCGMDAETLGNIFEPFFTTKSPGKGTGLGLSTAYGIVRQSGGQVEVQSRVGDGTVFQILLPASEPAADEPPSSLQPVKDGRRGTATILLVEDEEVVRHFTQGALEELGYEVLSACDGMEALEMAERCLPDVSLVLTDVVMPRLSGPDLMRRLVARRPNLPVVYMSGYQGDALLQRGSLGPETAYLQKPFTSDELSAAIQDALREVWDEALS